LTARRREKTPGQIVNEFEEMLAIERIRGKDKMSEGGSGEGSPNWENHDSWEKVLRILRTMIHGRRFVRPDEP
jgi:hypothetical protein